MSSQPLKAAVSFATQSLLLTEREKKVFFVELLCQVYNYQVSVLLLLFVTQRSYSRVYDNAM